VRRRGKEHRDFDEIGPARRRGPGHSRVLSRGGEAGQWRGQCSFSAGSGSGCRSSGCRSHVVAARSSGAAARCLGVGGLRDLGVSGLRDLGVGALLDGHRPRGTLGHGESSCLPAPAHRATRARCISLALPAAWRALCATCVLWYDVRQRETAEKRAATNLPWFKVKRVRVAKRVVQLWFAPFCLVACIVSLSCLGWRFVRLNLCLQPVYLETKTVDHSQTGLTHKMKMQLAHAEHMKHHHGHGHHHGHDHGHHEGHDQ
jgi:hypothetical protein